jgi:hypothetical protein
VRRRSARLWLVAVAAAACGCASLGLRRPGTADDPELVDVVVTDTSLEVEPGLVGRGKIGLELVNNGQLQHAVRVVGPGVDERSDELLTPGARGRLWLKLGPGTYRIFCPDGDHADRGLSSSLVVGDDVNMFRR